MARTRRINSGRRTKAGTELRTHPSVVMRRMNAKARQKGRQAQQLMADHPKSTLAIGVGVGAALGAVAAYLLQRRNGGRK